MGKIKPRFEWAASVVGAGPSDKILEIGCGAGLLAGRLAEAFVSGHITAIDKSASMIAKARKNNQRHIRDGIMTVGELDFKEFEKQTVFNKVIAFNVNLFLKDSPTEFRILQEILQDNGRLFCFYQFPYMITINAASPIAEHLETAGFDTKEILFKDIEPAPVICVIAQTKTL